VEILTIVVDGQPVSLLAVLLLGVVVGYVAGMFGLGGGILITPLLHVVFGIPLPVAIGSGLSQMVGTGLAGFMRHRAVGQGDARLGLLMFPGAILGVDAGARVIAWLEEQAMVRVLGRELPAVNLVVELAYGVGLLAVALLFWRQGRSSPDGSDPLEFVRNGPLARWRLGPKVELPAVSLQVSPIIVAELGLLLGFVSGVLGLGGGILMMPLLVYGFGFPMRAAAGAGLGLLVVTASVGTFSHAMHGNVHLGLSLTLLVGASISAQLGALATRKIPTKKLRRIFSAVVLLTVAAVSWDLVRRLTS
jgi:uncharacterized membrane protein YfcA